jgi:hypothetical protein
MKYIGLMGEMHNAEVSTHVIHRSKSESRKLSSYLEPRCKTISLYFKSLVVPAVLRLGSQRHNTVRQFTCGMGSKYSFLCTEPRNTRNFIRFAFRGQMDAILKRYRQRSGVCVPDVSWSDWCIFTLYICIRKVLI